MLPSKYIFLRTPFCILSNSYHAVTNMRKRYQSHDDLVITNYWEFLCLSFLQIVAKGYSQDFLPQWLKCKCIVSIKRRSWNNWFSEFTHTHYNSKHFCPFQQWNMQWHGMQIILYRSHWGFHHSTYTIQPFYIVWRLLFN